MKIVQEVVTFSRMFDRQLKDLIVRLLKTNPSVVLTGPRQIGKTTLAKQVAKQFKSVYVDLENPRDLEQAKDIMVFTERNPDKLIVLDEVQNLPEIFPAIRGIIDSGREAGRKHGHFLFLGSASLDLLRQTSESLAGRISHVELSSLNVLETGESVLDSLWLRGGFPESLEYGEEESFRWRSNLISTYLERDIPQFGFRVPAETLRQFWTILSHNQGCTLNYASLSKSLVTDRRNINRYLDILVDLLLVRKLLPWFTNTKKRIVKSPKVYIRDTGILHNLLSIRTEKDLAGHPVYGYSWEGFVIENIINCLGDNHYYPYFYRTQAGAEIDLLLCKGTTPEVAIEVKLSSNPGTKKGFDIACDDLNVKHRLVVYPGKETYYLKKNVLAVPLTELCKWLGKGGKGKIGG
ncbi:MAG: ATP-binding protein [Thermodesulfobacteriota bacterium]